jgi:hypothetical protein
VILREYKLIKLAIKKFDLDLSGLTVYTEAASNEYLWTPIIAAMAGARKVYAITRNSSYASADRVQESTMEHAQILNLEDCIEVVRKKKKKQIAQADIITNLGFVRPIDKRMIRWIKGEAVISLMWEPWEFRESDLDLAECRERNVTVLGTNEQNPRVRTFKYVGLTVLKLLFENRIEVNGCRIVLLGSGVFLEETKSCLQKNGAKVEVIHDFNRCLELPCDCVVCVEHHDQEICLIGENGLLHRDNVAGGIPFILHICGKVDIEYIQRMGWTCVPEEPAAPGMMSFTTAYLGPKPVIDLHAAGLKVGQAYLAGDRDSLIDLALEIP